MKKEKYNLRLFHLLIRIRRYLLFSFNYIFQERLHGLDFTLRSRKLLRQTDGELHGYSITPSGHLQEIFTFYRSMKPSGGSFLDIGCGKGFVLWKASSYSFDRICGIDIDDRLIAIAERNIRRLGLTHTQVLCEDARLYAFYEDFDCFFFSNPFDMEVFREVIDQIVLSLKTNPRRITIIYYHPTCSSYLEGLGIFHKVQVLYDEIRDYQTFIYAGEIL